MLHKIITLLSLLSLSWPAAFGWGKIGHDAVAYIAECNLTPLAKANIEKYLGGRSIVYYSSWMDKVRSTSEYGHTGKAHTFSVDGNGKYEPREGGDAVSMINEQVELLKDREQMTDSAVAVGIKILVHFVGDMHCPAHVKYPDRSQRITFMMAGNKYQFHSFWDGTSLEGNHRWYYTDYQYQLDRCSESERNALSAGTPIDWANENARNCDVIYQWILPRMDLGKAETSALMLKVEELADLQILKGGYRLASILNELFDN